MDSHALKPAAKWVKQRLTMRPRASLERHCHTSASLLPRQWHAVAGLATPALTCWLKYAIAIAAQQDLWEGVIACKVRLAVCGST